MNQLHVGFNREVEAPKGSYLLVCDEVPEVPKTVKVFDPKRDCFNPLKDTSYRANADFVSIIDAIFERGITVTVHSIDAGANPAIMPHGSSRARRHPRSSAPRHGRDCGDAALSRTQSTIALRLHAPPPAVASQAAPQALASSRTRRM